MILGPLHHLALGLLPWAALVLFWWLAPWSVLLAALGLGAVAVWLGQDTGLLGAVGQGQCPTPPAHQVPLDPDFDKKVVTWFYPGLGGSWMQALRYAGKEGKEGRSIPNAPLLMYGLWPINPPEVRILDSDGYFLSFLLALPWIFTTIITRIGVALHGIRNPQLYLLNVPLVSFAQRGDQEELLAEIQTRVRMYGRPARTILAGSSRGASTVLSTVAQMPPEEQNQVHLVLLEGAFDTVSSVARARFGPYLGPLITWVLTWATSYDPSAPTPLDLAKSFPAKVPVAFITSKADTVVPMAHTLALRDAVVAARGGNAEHVHVLVLEKSGHSFYANQDLADQTRYREFVDSLYRAYI
jgi:predicted esterase